MPDDRGVPTYVEALQMLARRAEEGSVTAIVALERALRQQHAERTEIDDVIDRLMAGTNDGAAGQRT